MRRIFLVVGAVAGCSWAGVRGVEIAERTAVLDGQPFGKSGAYERIVGSVRFGLKPGVAANRIVRDLEFAPLNNAGDVEFSADFYILQPRDPGKANGTVLFEVSNRGGKAMLSRFDFAHTAMDPRSADDFGDRWLLEQGYTLAWLGWEWDVPPSERAALHLSAPHFRPDALPAPGLVRSEFVTDRKVISMPLSDRGQQPIAVGRPIALYVLDTLDAAPRAIASGNWKLGADGKSVETEGGFEPGKQYDFVYEGRDPVVAGAGLAAVRDWVSFLKHGGSASLGFESTQVKRAIGFGISQSGRFLREFLYDGFNADEQGRRVFDGIWADVAGAGRGSFNYRYAQPSRDGHPFLNIFYPTDVFPFTDSPETDPVSGRTDSLLARAHAAGVEPKLFLTNNSYEYWGRVAALIHVTPDGKRDLPLAPRTRYYFLAGVQHFPRSSWVDKAAGARYLINPVDHRPVQRALLAALEAWVADGTEPPPSVYPKLAAGQLTPRGDLKFPPIEGVDVPRYPRPARRLDFGPDFLSRGIVTREPPKVEGAFPMLVPQSDADGIDLGGIRLPEVAVPVATITGWNLRAPGRGAPEQIAEFYGSIFPFAKTKAEREKTHDPRPSVAERYASRDEYLNRVNAAADRLIAQRFLLPQDKSSVVHAAATLWDYLKQ